MKKRHSIKKRFISLLLLAVTVFAIIVQPSSADIYVNGKNAGGGSMGSGQGTSFWNSGDEGIRVQVVDITGTQAKREGRAFDVTNLTASDRFFTRTTNGDGNKLVNANTISWHGGGSKLYHRNVSRAIGGVPFEAYITPYDYFNKEPDEYFYRAITANTIANSKGTATSLPSPIIYDGGQVDANVLKEWLKQPAFLTYAGKTAGFTGSDDEILARIKSGKYKLIVEPIIYRVLSNEKVAMTATEMGYWLSATGKVGGTSYNTLLANSLPLSMYLEKDEWLRNAGTPDWEKGNPDFSSWTGTLRNDMWPSDIIDTLGLWIISIAPYSLPPAVPKFEFSLEATPKEKEVEGPPGQSVPLGENAIITVDLKQTTENIETWEKALKDLVYDDGIARLWMNWTLTTTSGETIKDAFSPAPNYPYNGKQLTVDELRKILGYSVGADEKPVQDSLAVITLEDPVLPHLINELETIQYDYELRMRITFTRRREGVDESVVVNGLKRGTEEEVDTDYASWWRDKEPGTIVTIEEIDYRSNPDTYAEIKQGEIYKELWEAMAGVPTTRNLYFSVGGSEFIVDMEGTIIKEQEATRTYHARYSSVDCEYKTADTAIMGGQAHSFTEDRDDWSATWAAHGAKPQHPAANPRTYTWTAGSDGQTRTITETAVWKDTSVNWNCNIIPGTEDSPPIPHSPDTDGTASGYWQYTVTAHAICGPCCEHVLPAVDDSWVQEFTYDYLDFDKLTVWRLDEGRVTGMGIITGGNDIVKAATIQGQPNIFYNIADTETSKDGRFRYSLEPEQHDDVFWDMGNRDNKCDTRESYGGGFRWEGTTDRAPHAVTGSNVNYPEDAAPGDHSGKDPGGKEKSTFNDTRLHLQTDDESKSRPEFSGFRTDRNYKTNVTSIADFLILQTSSGDQPVMYYEQQSDEVLAFQDFRYETLMYGIGNPLEGGTYQNGSATKEIWTDNPKSAAEWTAKSVHLGSYNGKYAETTTKYNGLNTDERPLDEKTETILDDDPAKTIIRPERPAKDLYIAKYNIDILDTYPNGEYVTGIATTFWEVLENYNPNEKDQPYSIMPKSAFSNQRGHTRDSNYSPTHSKVNDIVIHDPVSVEYAMVITLPEERDQRIDANKEWSSQIRAEGVNKEVNCPGVPELCDFRYLNCTYTGTTEHTAECYLPKTPRTLNAHFHTLECLDMDKVREALTKIEGNEEGSEEFLFVNGVQTFIAPYTGTYKLETWGGQGGASEWNYGDGAYGNYASGNVVLEQDQTVSIYVGGAGSGSYGGYNGGGSGRTGNAYDGYPGGGGGATDMRINGTGLASRIIVAGGGGGAGQDNSEGFATGTNGVLGQGSNTVFDMGAGGGGYYGGIYGSAGSDGSYGWEDGGGAPGSNYTGGVTDGISQIGVNRGNGKAMISWDIEIPTTATEDISATLPLASGKIGNGRDDTWTITMPASDTWTASAALAIMDGDEIYFNDERYTAGASPVDYTFTGTTLTVRVVTQPDSTSHGGNTEFVINGVTRQQVTDELFAGTVLADKTYTVSVVNTGTSATLPPSYMPVSINGNTYVYFGTPGYVVVIHGAVLGVGYSFTSYYVTVVNGTQTISTVNGTPSSATHEYSIAAGTTETLPNTLPFSSGWIGHRKDFEWEITMPKEADWVVYATVNTEPGDIVYFDGTAHSGNQSISYAFTGSSVKIRFKTNGSDTSTGFTVTSISERTMVDEVFDGTVRAGRTYSVGTGTQSSFPSTIYDLYTATPVSINGGTYYALIPKSAATPKAIGGVFIAYAALPPNVLVTVYPVTITSGGVPTATYTAGTPVSIIMTRLSIGGSRYLGEDWGLIDMDEIIAGTVTDSRSGSITNAWIAKQSAEALAHILKCDGVEPNTHICDASCQHSDVLVCNEPHHDGRHYSINSTVCWSACNDDSRHQRITSANTTRGLIKEGTFVNLDWGFSIYYPNIGDFYQSDLLGIPETTSVRGISFIDQMDCTEWLAKKRVKFEFDVIFCGLSEHAENHQHTSACKAYKAFEWVDLTPWKEYEYYYFYIPAEQLEMAYAKVTFESVAINAPDLLNDNFDTTTNRLRYSNHAARHGATKYAYTDVVGRIGNSLMVDTGDWRFSNLFKVPVDGNTPDDWYVQGVVKKVDTKQQNYTVADTVDLRGIPNVTDQDVYGLTAWIRNKLIGFPLTPDKNNIQALKKEAVRVGYPLYMSVDTLGRHYKEIGIQPYYYWYEPGTDTATPIDVYMITENGSYKKITSFYDDNNEAEFRYALNWDKEKERRNITDAENTRTQELADFDQRSYPVGDWYPLGHANLLYFLERARTYFGSNVTRGYEQNLQSKYYNIDFALSAKRWHYTLGLPSSAIYVDAGMAPTQENLDKYKEREDGYVLVACTIYSFGDIWSLKHKVSATLGGVDGVIAVFDGDESSRDDLTIRKTH